MISDKTEKSDVEKSLDDRTANFHFGSLYSPTNSWRNECSISRDVSAW